MEEIKMDPVDTVETNAAEENKKLLDENRRLKVRMQFVKSGAEDEDYLCYRYFEKAEFDEQNAFVNGEELVAAAKKECEAFFKKAEIEGVRPAENSKIPTMSKKDFAALGYSQRMELYHRNPELYRQLAGN